MATVRTVTVKASCVDYTSLASAEAGEQGNLVSLDRQLDIECYASAAPDTTQVMFDGWTTDSTRYIRVLTPLSERHDGKWNTSKYYMEHSTTGDPGGVLACREEYTIFEGLQIRNTKASPTEFNDCIYTEARITVIKCITRGGYYGINVSIANSEVRNSIAYGAVRGGYVRGFAGGSAAAYNCTFIGSQYGLNTDASVNYPIAKNVYAHGGTACYSNNGGANLLTKTNCMSSDTTATNNAGGGGATNCTNNIAHDTNNFTNVTAGSEDYHIPTGSALKDAGVDLSGQFTDDIDGDTRSGTWDVGADEFTAGGGGGPTPIRSMPLMGI